MTGKYGDEAVRLFCDVMRRVELEKLSEMKLDSGAKMGAYAAALAGGGDMTAAIAIDREYRPLGSAVLQRGGGALPEQFGDKIVKLCRRSGAKSTVICVSHRITPEEILSFGRLYLFLRLSGITFADLFEVCGCSYISVFSDLGSRVYPEEKAAEE